jgi:tRNA 2-thiouridine synthesizing protein E
MRQICREAGLSEHCVSELFIDPRLAWRIAGLPNPGEEAKVYLETSELGN